MNKTLVKEMPLCGYAVEWSPYVDGVMAVSASQNFGIIGKGAQFVYQLRGGVVDLVSMYETEDGVYDCSWSEHSDTQLAFGLGNGRVVLWDYSENRVLNEWNEHTAEVYSVEWGCVNKDIIATGSWDHNIKIWNPEIGTALSTLRSHKNSIYTVRWHPRYADMLCSVSGDQTVKIWDTNSDKPAVTFHGHDFEILACDWSKYDSNTLYTGSVDKSIRQWDIRSLRQPVRTITGHGFAVRKLKSSPFSGDQLLSCSYDMSVKLWDVGEKGGEKGTCVWDMEDHTEFVVGIDWNYLRPGQVASVAWDDTIRISSIDSVRM